MQTSYHIISASRDDGQTWGKDELIDGSPLRRMRQILGGSWAKSYGDLETDMAMAAFRGPSRVFTLRLPRGITRDAALRIIAAGRAP